jgi:lipoprotein-releasing system ATP-binding protein
MLGALDHPTSGTVRLEGTAFEDLGPEALAAVRNRKLGFVFQFHHLLREFTALENVMMPLLIGGAAESAARSKAEELLAAVGLAGRMTHRPAALSGGEQQRVAVARALATDPVVVLADEPSGNLDHHHAERLHDLFASLAREFETALVVVTHNRLLAARADRVLTMEGGRLRVATELEATPR